MKSSKTIWSIVTLITLVSISAAASVLSYGAGQQNGMRIQSGGEPPPVGTVTGRSAIRGFHYAVSDTEQHPTNSTTFVPVPDMSIDFSLEARGDVLITYCAEAWAPADRLMYVTAQVDGIDAQPGELQFTGDADEDDDGRWSRAHSFQWVFPAVQPGTHTVEIMFRGNDGGTVHMHGRSMIVMHG